MSWDSKHPDEDEPLDTPQHVDSFSEQGSPHGERTRGNIPSHSPRYEHGGREESVAEWALRRVTKPLLAFCTALGIALGIDQVVPLAHVMQPFVSIVCLALIPLLELFPLAAFSFCSDLPGLGPSLPRHRVAIAFRCLALLAAGLTGLLLAPTWQAVGVIVLALTLMLASHRYFRESNPPLRAPGADDNPREKVFTGHLSSLLDVTVTASWKGTLRCLVIRLRQCAAVLIFVAIAFGSLAAVTVALEGEPSLRADKRSKAGDPKSEQPSTAPENEQVVSTEESEYERAGQMGTVETKPCAPLTADDVPQPIAEAIEFAFSEPGPGTGCPQSTSEHETPLGLVVTALGEGAGCSEPCSIVVYSKAYEGAHIYLAPAVQQIAALTREYGAVGGPKTFPRYPAGTTHERGDYYLVTTGRGSYVLIREAVNHDGEAEPYLELPPSVAEAWLSAMKEAGWLWPHRVGLTRGGEEVFRLGDFRRSSTPLRTVYYDTTTHTATRAEWHFEARQNEIPPQELERLARGERLP
ncbi:MAG TPA: hypothetical protein VGF95_11310 [Solirubrobacteraceae bacterium]|jgi:hypothetical protein